MTPVKEETKPIATTPKLRGKRNVNQTECEKPHEEYSAEADDEMEEEIRMCNKKKLMVALKDINADKKLVEGSSVKTYSLEQRDKSSGSSSSTNNSTPSKVETNIVVLNQAATLEKVPSASDLSDKSMSDRHSVAVAKKTKKQKIIENEVENIEIDVRKRDEFKEPNDRLEEPKIYDSNDKNQANEEVEPAKAPETIVDEPNESAVSEKEDDVNSSNELGSDDMEICDDTTNTTPAYEPPKLSPQKSAYTKLDSTQRAPPEATMRRESHENDREKPMEPKTSGADVRQPTFSNNSPTKPHDKWTNDSLRTESSPKEMKSLVIKTNDSSENQSPSKMSTTIVSPSKKQHENVVKSPTLETRPNVIVDAMQSEPQEVPKQVSTVKSDHSTEIGEQKLTEKQPSPVKLSTTIVSPKASPIVRVPSETNVANKVDDSEKDTSPTKHFRKCSTSEFETEVETNKTKSPPNRSEHQSPHEKSQNQPNIQLSPEKSRDAKNSVIKSVIEPNATLSDCVPVSGSTVDVSKNDETKTTTQDFCQRIDPNKTPQCVRSEAKIEAKHEPFNMDQAPPSTVSVAQSSIERTNRMPESAKTSPKEAILQPKEEPNRMEMNQSSSTNSVNCNQQNESCKNRYKQQQSHGTKQTHSSSKAPNNDLKKNTSSNCGQTSHMDIKRETKAEIKSNSGYGNESVTKRESPTKRDTNKQSAGYSSSSSSKNFTNESTLMSGSKSSMANNSSSMQSNSEKKHAIADKKSNANDKKSNSAEKKAPDMRGNIDNDLNKMRSQFTMNQLPNYHTAHQYYNLSAWDPYNYHSGYNLPHLDPSGTQKSPTKFHKDLANSMYGGMTSNYLAANTLAAQQSQQQQVGFLIISRDKNVIF